jgi:hypothetical protein
MDIVSHAAADSWITELGMYIAHYPLPESLEHSGPE